MKINCPYCSEQINEDGTDIQQVLVPGMDGPTPHHCLMPARHGDLTALVMKFDRLVMDYGKRIEALEGGKNEIT